MGKKLILVGAILIILLSQVFAFPESEFDFKYPSTTTGGGTGGNYTFNETQFDVIDETDVNIETSWLETFVNALSKWGDYWTKTENIDQSGYNISADCLGVNGEYICNWTDVNQSGGGSSVSFGTEDQIPFTNAGGDDFDYDLLEYDSDESRLSIGNVYIRRFSNETYFMFDDFDDDYNPFSDNTDYDYYGGGDNFQSSGGDIFTIDDEPTPATRYYIYNVNNPPTMNYKITVNETLGWGSNNAAYARLVGRRVDDNNYYLLFYRIFREPSGGGDIYLYKIQNGISTLLDSVDDGISHPNSGSKQVELSLEMNGDSIRGLVDGVEKVSATDGNITGKGQFGFGLSDSYSSTANNYFLAHGFWMNNVNEIGHFGTEGDYDWFGMRNGRYIFRVEDEGVKFPDGKKIIFRSANEQFQSTIEQNNADFLQIGGTSMKVNNQMSAGSIANNLLEFKSYTYDEENLFSDVFTEDYAEWEDSPVWSLLYGDGTEEVEVTGGEVTTDDTYNDDQYAYMKYDGEMTSNNYTIETDLKLGWTSTNYGLGGVLGRVVDEDNFVVCRMIARRSASGGADVQLYLRSGGSFTLLNSSDVVSSPSNPYIANLKLVVEGDNYECFVNDVSYLTATNNTVTEATGVGAMVQKGKYTSYASAIDNWKAYRSGEYSIIGTKTDTPLRFKTHETERWEIDTDGNLNALFNNQNITLGNTTITSSEITVDKITALATDPLMMVFTPTTFDRVQRMDSVIPTDKKGLTFWFNSLDPDNLQSWNALTGETYTIPMKKGKKQNPIEVKSGYYYDYQKDQYYRIEKVKVEIDLKNLLTKEQAEKYAIQINTCKSSKVQICKFDYDERVYVSNEEAIK